MGAARQALVGGLDLPFDIPFRAAGCILDHFTASSPEIAEQIDLQHLRISSGGTWVVSGLHR
jgi:hypothetical protein